MTPHQLVSQTSGDMPSIFSSASASRSRSLPDNSHRGSTSSSSTYTRRGSATLDALTRGLKKKSEIEIILDGKNDFIRTYSTFDQITGHVELKFERDTIIGNMNVSFEGMSQTYVEKVASASPTTGRTTGRHTFLRVQQPISAETLPEDMLAKANTVYTVPFTFVVPDRLLSYICQHTVDNDDTKRQHLHVPPSIGEPMLSGKGNVLMDDLSPEMAKIVYFIKARVSKLNPASGRLHDIEEKMFRIRLAPAREEAPPLSIDEESGAYALRKEKNVRKGVFKIGKKLGRLTAEVAQPKSLRLPPASCTSNAPVTTMAAVTLRFDPASEQEQPPQLGNLSAKLKSYTFFGAAAYKTLPQTSSCDIWSPLHGLYPNTVPLSCRNVGGVAWTKHDPGSRSKSVASQASAASDGAGLSRRQSTLSIDSSTSSNSDASVPAASAAYDSSLPFYSARVLVPISLPIHAESEEGESGSSSKSPLNRGSKKIIFVPTFHTCIISRTYALELGLSFNPVSASGNTSNSLGSSSVTLRSPIQVSQEGASSPPEGIFQPLDMALVEGTDEYDEAMARRLDRELNSPNPFRDYYSSSVEAIPEYEEVQTTVARPDQMARHASIAVPPSVNTGAAREQPPEYYSSPFRNPGPPPAGGRRHTVVTQYPSRNSMMPMLFLSAL